MCKKRCIFFLILSSIIACQAAGQTQERIDDSLTVSLLETTGLKLKLQEYQRSIQDDMEKTILIIPLFRNVRRAFLEAFHPDSIYNDMRRYIHGHYNSKRLTSVVNWLGTQTGKKINDWQMRSASSEAYDRKNEIAASIQLQQTTDERLSLFRRLDAATLNSENRKVIRENFFRSLTNQIDSLLPIKEAEKKEEFIQYIQREGLKFQTGAKKFTNAEFIYTYRTISDQELRQYVTFCESAAGLWYHRLLYDAFSYAVKAAVKRLPLIIKKAGSEIQYDLKNILEEKNENDEDNETDILGWKELHFAAADGDTDKVNALLRFGGADVNVRNAKGRTPLYEASKRGKLGSVEILVRRGANINIQEGKYGFTPLHVAGEKKQLGVVEFLLTHGADVNARNDYGKTPLFQASWQVWHNDASVAKLLLSHGADINAKDIFGFTPLLTATDYGHVPFAVLLIEKGANVNLGTKDGYMPLHAAAYKGQYEIVKLLLEHGANVNAMYDGITPLYYANKYRRSKISDLLRQYGGADPESKSNALTNVGVELSKRGDYRNALMEFDRAINTGVPSAQDFYNRGYCFWKLGMIDEALQDMQKAIYRDHEFEDAYDLLVTLHMQRQEYDRVIDYAHKLLQLNPRNVGIYYMRGFAYYKKGNIQEAIEDLRRGCDMGNSDCCEMLRRLTRR